MLRRTSSVCGAICSGKLAVASVGRVKNVIPWANVERFSVSGPFSGLTWLLNKGGLATEGC
jgi:hypothetical protein